MKQEASFVTQVNSSGSAREIYDDSLQSFAIIQLNYIP